LKRTVVWICFLVVCIILTVVGIGAFFIPDEDGTVLFFAVFLSIIAAIFDIGFIYAILISKLPARVTKATIVAKNVVVKNERVGRAYHKRTYYKITFKTENQFYWTFNLSLALYNAFIEGDYGTLSYRESKRKQIYYVGFQRIR